MDPQQLPIVLAIFFIINWYNLILLLSNACIIEIKLDRVMPIIISDLISKFNLHRCTFSKYSKSLENNYDFYNGLKLD